MLAEEQKLHYDDLITHLLPRLPGSYVDVTLRHLLAYTSGVYDYDDIGRGRPGNIMGSKKSLRFSSGGDAHLGPGDLK